MSTVRMVVAQHDQGSLSNRLLNGMAAADYAALGPHLEMITTELHDLLIAPRMPIEQLFFPESGFASVTTIGPGRLEVGLIGREGLVGIAALLGDDETPYEHFIQAPGTFLRIDRDALMRAFESSPSLRRRLLGYVHTVLIQTAQTAYVNATYGIEARLVRWLLMCQDRLGGDELSLTHEFLAMMLGVQRTSVTLALQTLEGSGLIRARRGRIEIRDRDKMVLAANGGYGVPEAAYRRLIGA